MSLADQLPGVAGESVSVGRILRQAEDNGVNGWVGQFPVGKEHKGRLKLPWRKGRHGYNGVDATPEEFERLVHSVARQIKKGADPGVLSLGVRCPLGVLGIDVDAYDGRSGAETLDRWRSQFGPLPATYRVSARVDGISGIYLFRVPNDFYPKEPPNGGVEFLDRHHRYLVAPPSWHHTGRPYQLYMPNGLCSATGVLPLVEDLPQLPQTYLEGLPQAAVAGRGREADSAEVARFELAYDSGPQPDMVPHLIRRAKAANADSVRNAVRDALCWAAREAKGGRYSWWNAVEQIQLWAEKRYAKRDRQLDLAEFAALQRYAVGAVRDTPEAALRAKWDRDFVSKEENNQ
ncbi:bifunctional DNA primase/polymerase [Mycolicibacterium llatzerense]|uniref:bifunctional DNA primase/polymerase n=1 Tax=Mycolicibacterium llatzerense TaxID=280871 RepID=UPI0021B65E35|nr:bifunctional DNA primase/polymerase [Mycolicibacterium llatzerense]